MTADLRTLIDLVTQANAGTLCEAAGDDPTDLHEIRCFLETHWSAFHQKRGSLPPAISEGMCRHSVLFLHKLFKDLGIQGWKIGGGYCLVKGSDTGTIEYKWLNLFTLADMTNQLLYHDAFKKPDGANWYDGTKLMGRHWWLENGSQIIDLTGDQFGWEPVYHGPIDQRYLRVEELSNLTAVRAAKSVVARWEKEWLARNSANTGNDP